MYMLFMGPPELDAEWQDSGLEGTKRFLNKLWSYLTDETTLLPHGSQEELSVTKRFHRFLKGYQERIELFKPNTAISACMEWLNDAHSQSMKLSRDTAEKLLIALSTIIPFTASELLEQLFKKELSDCIWPTPDPKFSLQDEIEMVVQVNGKTRATFKIVPGASEETVRSQATIEAHKWIVDKKVVKVIFVKDRLINFVVSEK
jgi:leucyl-tRNA synthetase